MRYSTISTYFVALMLIIIVFTVSSCEELGVTSDNDNNSAETLLAQFGPDSLMVIQDEDINLKGGVIPFLKNDIILEGDLLDETIFFIPGPGGRVSNDGKIRFSDMMALIYIPDHMQPLSIKEDIPPTKWLINGEDFVPGDEWSEGDDKNIVSTASWLPEDRSALDVLLYPGTLELTELFGKNEDELGIRESRLFSDELIETDKKLAIAVPADVLFNIDISFDKDFSEIIDVSKDQIAMSTSGHLENGALFVSSKYAAGNDSPGMSIPLFKGKNFFKNETFTVGPNSVLNCPIGKEATGNNPFLDKSSPLLYDDKGIILFCNDYFVDNPDGTTVVLEPDEQLDTKDKYVMLNGGKTELSPYPFAGPSLQENKLTMPRIPENFYYPDEYKFPTDFFAEGTEYHIIGMHNYFKASVLSEHAVIFSPKN